MKLNGAHVVCLLLLFLASLLLCTEAELDGGSKKRGDITRKSNTNEESEEEVPVEDMENAFEQLRELSALRDTILKLVPASDYDKISKQAAKKDEGTDEGKTEVAAKEPLDNPGTRNVWTKTMIAETKDMDPLDMSTRQLDDDDMESWEEHELYKLLDEDIQEPLTPEQEAGRFGITVPWFLWTTIAFPMARALFVVIISNFDCYNCDDTFQPSSCSRTRRPS